MPENEPKTGGKQEQLLGILSERVSCLERTQRLQHAEISKLFAGIRALQTAFDLMTTTAAAPKN